MDREALEANCMGIPMNRSTSEILSLGGFFRIGRLALNVAVFDLWPQGKWSSRGSVLVEGSHLSMRLSKELQEGIPLER